jgi:hypothetical protein
MIVCTGSILLSENMSRKLQLHSFLTPGSISMCPQWNEWDRLTGEHVIDL